MPRHRLVLRSNLAELSQLAQWTQDFASQADLSYDTSFAVQLCVEEAVANIVMYGGAPPARQEIAVEMEQVDCGVVVIIEDSARAFDPTQVPRPPRPASIEEARIGELGIHLMRSFASEMRYERREGRNRLILRFLRPESAVASQA